MNDKQQAAKQIIATLSNALCEIDEQLNSYTSVLLGTPWVIEVCPSMYLVADGEGYRGGFVTGKTVMYSRERLDDVLETVRKSAPNVWGNARAVHIKDALAEERKKTCDLINKIEALTV